MPIIDWIICERSNRWAAALRLAVGLDTATVGPKYRLREVRSLGELSSELVRPPTSVVGVEVHRANFGDVLSWLAAAERQFPRAHCVALLDRSLKSANDGRRSPARGFLDDARAALREAGAIEIVDSPRRIEILLAVGRHHATANSTQDSANATLSLVEQLWATLPWHEA